MMMSWCRCIFVNYVCVRACDGAWNCDLVKMILPANSKGHNGKREKYLSICAIFCEEDGFWSQFSLSQFWPLSSSLVLHKGREDRFEGLKGGGELGYGASLGGPLCDAYNPTLGLFLVLVYIRQVTTIRQDRNTQHKDLPNTITMVVEPSTPQVAWISWWTHAAWGVGGLAHDFSKADIQKQFNKFNKLK